MVQASQVNRTIVDGIWHQSEIHPSKVAIKMGEVQITYRQLVNRINNIANTLLSSHKSDKRIGIWLQNEPDYLALFYGIVLARSVAVPLPADLPSDQLRMYKESLGLDEIWDGELLQSSVQYNYYPLATPNQYTAIHSEDLFYMAVSSGSTGSPKGILRNHHSWATSFDRMSQAFELDSQDTILIPGPLHYSASLIAALQVLDQGGKVVLLPRFSTDLLVEHLLRSEITSVFLVPTMCAHLLTYVENRVDVVSQLGKRRLTAVTAGAKMGVELKQKWIKLFPEGKLFEYYGAAELSFVSLLNPEEQITHADSVGKAFAGVELLIMDDAGNVLSPHQIGQVYIRSEMIAQGYGHLHAEEFITPVNGFYTVGDVGYLDEAGYLYLTGRKQEMIIRGGVNIYPLELELAIRQLCEVEDVAVFGIPDEGLGEKIVAVVVLHHEASFELSDHAKEQVEGYVYPRKDFHLHKDIAKLLPHSRYPDHYWVLNQLPLGTTGKVDKQALCKRWLEEGWNVDGERF